MDTSPEQLSSVWSVSPLSMATQGVQCRECHTIATKPYYGCAVQGVSWKLKWWVCWTLLLLLLLLLLAAEVVGWTDLTPQKGLLPTDGFPPSLDFQRIPPLAFSFF